MISSEGKSKKHVVNVKVLHGQPTDGSGKVAIHLFVRDPNGPFVEPHVLYPVMDDNGQPGPGLTARATRGRLACDPRRTVAPVVRGGVTTVTIRSDDPRAVTCPKCMASKDYTDLMTQIEGK